MFCLLCMCCNEFWVVQTEVAPLWFLWKGKGETRFSVCVWFCSCLLNAATSGTEHGSFLTTFRSEGWLLQVKLIEGYLTVGRGKQTPWIIDGNLSILPLLIHSWSRFIRLAPPIVQLSPAYIHSHCFSLHVLYIQTLSQLYIQAPFAGDPSMGSAVSQTDLIAVVCSDEHDG